MAERSNSSDDELKTSVASFMGRADAIVAREINPENMAMRLVITQDKETGALVPQSVDIPLMPLPDLFYLAVQMRPIIFTEQELVSFNVMTKRIEREHDDLRGRLKPGRDKFQEWKKHMFLGLQKLGTVDPPLPPGQDAMVAQVLIGPPGESPSGIPLVSSRRTTSTPTPTSTLRSGTPTPARSRPTRPPRPS